MIPVTEDFKERVAAPSRAVLARTVITLSDTVGVRDIDVEPSDRANVCWPEQVADAKEQATAKWASLDSTWVLDDTYHLAPHRASSGQMGWWSGTLAGPGGVFADPPFITLKLHGRPIDQVKVIGDDKRGEWAVDFVVELLAADSAALATYNVTNNAAIDWRKTFEQRDDIDRVRLTVYKWSHADRQAKILDILDEYVDEYGEDNILSLKLQEERDVDTDGIPTGSVTISELDLRLNNADRRWDLDNTDSPVYGRVKPKRKVKAYLGVETPSGVEWVSLGVFWTGDWYTNDYELYAETTCRSRLQFLADSEYATNKLGAAANLAELAADVLEDAGVAPDEYWIDPTLLTYLTPNSWLDRMSHRAALQEIAEACAGRVYTDRDGIIRVEGAECGEQSATPAAEVLSDSYFRKEKLIRTNQLVNQITVTAQPTKINNTPEMIYESDEPQAVAGGQVVTVTADYSYKPCAYAVATLDAPEGVEIVQADYYSYGAVIIVQNLNSTTKQFSLTITGNKLEDASAIIRKAQDAASQAEYGVVALEYPGNHLISTGGHAQALAGILLARHAEPGRYVELEWRGNPALTLGDVIQADRYRFGDGTERYRITEQSLDYTGALRGSIKGRRV